MSDRIAIVTGASSGIGAALAEVLAERGYAVALVARRADRLADVLAACRRHVPESEAWPEDLGDPEAATRIVERALATYARVDVLINNAALPGVRHVSRLDADEVARVMDVNLHAPVRLTLGLLPHMLERGSGTIVNVSSLGGRLGIPGEAAYCASKFALSGWSESLALDLAGTGVRVRLILPGAVDTEIWEKGDEESSYDGPKVPARDVAVGIADSIDSDAFEHYVPDLSGVVRYKTEHIDDYFAKTLETLRPTQ